MEKEPIVPVFAIYQNNEKVGVIFNKEIADKVTSFLNEVASQKDKPIDWDALLPEYREAIKNHPVDGTTAIWLFTWIQEQVKRQLYKQSDEFKARPEFKAKPVCEYCQGNHETYNKCTKECEIHYG